VLFYLADTPASGHVAAMLNLVSILIGLVALPFALVGVIPFPFVPLLNWVALPIAIVGAVVGMLSRSNSGRNFNLVIVLIAGLRVFLTGGLI
jgi:hypothetical protein